MKLLSICLFAVLFLFQVTLGLNLGNSQVHESAGMFHNHGPQGGPGAPSGGPPPPPPNATSSD